MDETNSLLPQTLTLPPAASSADGHDNERSFRKEEENLPFSWIQYSVLFALGIAILWASAMFMSSIAYFKRRFEGDDWILAHFESAILSVSTITNLVTLLALNALQPTAEYPKRVRLSLYMNTVIFTMLALSTICYQHVAPVVFLAFLLTMVFFSSIAIGMGQNGAFAIVVGFGRAEYIQALMTGSSLAGLLPCITKIISVLFLRERKLDSNFPKQDLLNAELYYFLFAAGVEALTLLLFTYFLYQHIRDASFRRALSDNNKGIAANSATTLGIRQLLIKLNYTAAAMFLCFVVTMFYPVLTSEILSVSNPDTTPRILQAEVFIPLAFLVWTSGDLTGQLLTLIPSSINHQPSVLFAISLGRIVILPIYLLCNVHGHGAYIKSDLFYLFVQLLFGISNGWLASRCMIAASQMVQQEEKEAVGGFMAIVLSIGLAAGSLLSFTVTY